MNTCITLHNFTDSPKICWAGNFINSFRIEIASICYNAFSLLFLNLELGGIIQMLMLMWSIAVETIEIFLSETHKKLITGEKEEKEETTDSLITMCTQW